MDEAQKKQIQIDIAGLSKHLGIPVVGASARSGRGLSELMDAVQRTACLPHVQAAQPLCDDPVQRTEEIFQEAERICGACVTHGNPAADARRVRADRLLTGRLTGIPVMLLLLSLVFFITLAGANYPSALLSKWLFAPVSYTHLDVYKRQCQTPELEEVLPKHYVACHHVRAINGLK